MYGCRIARIESRQDSVCALTYLDCAPSLSAELCNLVEDTFDLAAVDVEFAGYGALAVASLVARADGLLQGWRNREFRWRVLRIPSLVGVLIACP
jgi:hypothetical protein